MSLFRLNTNRKKMPFRIFNFLILILLATVSGNTSNDFLVHLNNGDIRGGEMTREDGKKFYAFRGIPFAEPPLGNLRFKPPIPKRPWKGVLDATKDGPPCPQMHLFLRNYIGSEDCLYLNVYTPKLPNKDDRLLDVIFHIHGGGFTFGEGSSNWYGPRRFKLDEVILVSFTYRVSAIGFLSTNDSASPGNYGLLDQTEALRWVRDNIHHFGGNPDSVTILGESAGGASIIYHMLSPLSKGYFHRAISMSGSPVCSWASQKNPVYWAKKLGEELKCPTEDSDDLIQCLLQKSSKEIIEKGSHYLNHHIMIPFTPVVDNYFLPESPVDLLLKGKFQKNIPLLIGATKNEGACFNLGRKLGGSDFTDQEITEDLSGTVDCRPNVDQSIQKVKEKYFSDLPSYKENEVQSRIARALTDGMFHKCIWFTAKTMLEAGTETYLYSYDYESPFSSSKFFDKQGKYGVCHADDLFMLFDGPFFPVKSFDEISENVKIKLQKILTNFAKYGKPLHSDDDHVDCQWPRALPNEMHMYHINQKCSVDIYDETKDEFYDFWIKDILKILPQTSPVRDEL